MRDALAGCQLGRLGPATVASQIARAADSRAELGPKLLRLPEITDASGFPLTVQEFEGNKAETATMLPVINAFKAAHQLTDATVVAVRG